MIVCLFGVRDRSADCFGAPFSSNTESMAIREFQQACKDPAHAFAKWPTDFSLYKLGYFNDNSGKVEALQEPLFLCSADGVMGGSGSDG